MVILEKKWDIIDKYDKDQKKTGKHRNCAFSVEALEIASYSKACNIIEHFSIDKEWQQIFKEDDMYRKREGKMTYE